jgi:hypothetical protein
MANLRCEYHGRRFVWRPRDAGAKRSAAFVMLSANRAKERKMHRENAPERVVMQCRFP